MKVIFCDLRADALPLIKELTTRGFEIRGLEGPAKEVIKDEWDAVRGAIDAIDEFVEKYHPVAALLWNSVQPAYAAAALTFRRNGVPVIEVCHWRISTTLLGHFENDPLADYLICSKEIAEFHEGQNAKTSCRPFGQIGFATWTHRKKEEARRYLQLPTNGKWILATSSWTHSLSNWSDPAYDIEHNAAIFDALSRLQEAEHLNILWSTRGRDPKITGNFLSSLGLKNLHVTSDNHIKDLIDAADVVVSQKSGALVDAVVQGRPVLMVDFKPNSDFYRFKNKGILRAQSHNEVETELATLLSSPRVVSNQLKQQKKWREWFGATGTVAKDTADFIEKICNG